MDRDEYQKNKNAMMTFEEATNLVACIEWTSTINDLFI